MVTIQAYLPLATFLTLLGLWGHLVVVHFKVGLMWKDFCARKGINGGAKALKEIQ